MNEFLKEKQELLNEMKDIILKTLLELQTNVINLQKHKVEYINCNASVILEPDEDFEPGDKCFVMENDMLLFENEKKIRECDYWIEELSVDIEYYNTMLVSIEERNINLFKDNLN